MGGSTDDPDFRTRQLVDNLPDAVMTFDTDLRLQLAGGRPLRHYGYDAPSLTGRLLSEVIPPEALAVLGPKYEAALSGTSEEYNYTSPVSGGNFLVRFQPIRDEHGEIVGVMSVTSDLARLRGLEFELEHARHLISIGSAAFERHSGWTVEPALLDMWGLDSVTLPSDVIDTVIVPEDRDAVRELWNGVRTGGGSAKGMDYRIIHGRTGAMRNLHGAVQAEIGDDGELLTASLTHVDVTEMVRARAEVERSQTELTHQRETLLRRVSDVVMRANVNLEQAMQMTIDLVVPTLAEGCALRLLSADRQRVEWYSVSHQDEARREDWMRWLASEEVRVEALPPFIQESVTTGEATWGSAFALGADEPAWFTGMRYIAAPIRNFGEILGVLTSVRTPDERPFDTSEVSLIQMLADRIGAMVAAERARIEADEQGARRRVLGSQLQAVIADQRDLVQQLDRTESKERMRLAEAVHDEPLQLVVAAMLRLEVMRGQLPPASGDPVDDIERMLETAVEQLRTLIGTLTPPDLSAGLGPALRALAEATFLGSLHGGPGQRTRPCAPGPQDQGVGLPDHPRGPDQRAPACPRQPGHHRAAGGPRHGLHPPVRRRHRHHEH